MAQQILAGPLLVAHLDDELRLDPDVAAARRDARRRTAGVGARLRREKRVQLVEELAGEAGADASGVDEAGVAAVGEVERAEARSRALRAS